MNVMVLSSSLYSLWFTDKLISQCTVPAEIYFSCYKYTLTCLDQSLHYHQLSHVLRLSLQSEQCQKSHAPKQRICQNKGKNPEKINLVNNNAHSLNMF